MMDIMKDIGVSRQKKREEWKSLTMEKKLELSKQFAEKKGGNIHGWF